MDFEQRQILALMIGGIADVLLLVITKKTFFGYLGVSSFITGLVLMILRLMNNKHKKRARKNQKI
jgi:hypothetical protein